MPYLKSRKAKYRPTLPTVEPMPFPFLLPFSLPSTLFPYSSWSSSFFLADYWVNLAYLSRHPSSGPQPFYSLSGLPLIPRELRRGLRVSEIHPHTVYAARHCLCISSHTLCPVEELGIASVTAPLGRLVHAPLNPDSARETTWASRTRGGDNARRGDGELPSARSRRPREVVNCPR
jgi:hypothetical protein